jgi:hypothetical protein
MRGRGGGGQLLRRNDLLLPSSLTMGKTRMCGEHHLQLSSVPPSSAPIIYTARPTPSSSRSTPAEPAGARSSRATNRTMPARRHRHPVRRRRRRRCRMAAVVARLGYLVLPDLDFGEGDAARRRRDECVELLVGPSIMTMTVFTEAD